MAIERTTERLFGLIRKTEIIKVGADLGLDAQESEGSPRRVIAFKVTDPDTIFVQIYERDPRDLSLHRLFVPIYPAGIYIGEEINEAKLHSTANLAGRLIGVSTLHWRP